ncbi:MAG: hypothetical protein BMS9Abin25_1395 [Gammaproteobacteria bacterium]|nr:MAG: hypothetical protein BMS9Abin25_1395 [Gammaproteobacteria bacterium]
MIGFLAGEDMFIFIILCSRSREPLIMLFKVYHLKTLTGAYYPRTGIQMLVESVYILPVFLFQQIGKDQENCQKNENIYAQFIPYHLHGFANVNQKVG